MAYWLKRWIRRLRYGDEPVYPGFAYLYELPDAGRPEDL